MIPFCILVIEDDDDREFMAALFMYFYFTHNNYWTASDYANCNAGGIIFLKDTSGTRYHVVMCVQNNTVTRLYSAHTQDALKVPYTGKSSFGTSCNSLEYWVFTNSDTN